MFQSGQQHRRSSLPAKTPGILSETHVSIMSCSLWYIFGGWVGEVGVSFADWVIDRVFFWLGWIPGFPPRFWQFERSFCCWAQIWTICWACWGFEKCGIFQNQRNKLQMNKNFKKKLHKLQWQKQVGNHHPSLSSDQITFMCWWVVRFLWCIKHTHTHTHTRTRTRTHTHAHTHSLSLLHTF